MNQEVLEALFAGLVLGLALAAPVQAAEPPALAKGELASLDVLGGGSDPGAWAVGVRAGWPWMAIRGQVGLPGGVTPLLEVDTALFRRWQPSLGVSGRLLDHGRGRLSVEVLLGWQIQTGDLAQRGPSGAVRLRLLGIVGRANPWLAVGGRHTLLFDRTTTISADATTVDWSVRHRWSPSIAGGVVIGISKHIGLDLGLDWHFVDVGSTAVSLPGIHLGVQFGGGR